MGKNNQNIRKYKQFNYPGSQTGGKTLLTGIRNVECSDKKYICGFYEPSTDQKDQQTKSFVYKGPVNKGPVKKCIKQKHTKKWYELYYPGADITNLYGPANDECGGIQIVGNYTNYDSNNIIGCMYSCLLYTSPSPRDRS